MAVAAAAGHQRHRHTIKDFIARFQVHGGDDRFGEERGKAGEDTMQVAGAAIELALR
jgi:hypothetical protein